jgi:hypothetical protein
MCDSQWATIWSAAQAIATFVAVLVAAYQIWALRADQKAWKTLEACEKYETSATIVAASRELRAGLASGEIDSSSAKYRVGAMIMLNLS